MHTTTKRLFIYFLSLFSTLMLAFGTTPLSHAQTAAQDNLTITNGEWGHKVAFAVGDPIRQETFGTRLFEVNTSPARTAYCIEWDVPVHLYGTQSLIAPWADFPGHNSFRSNPEHNRERINWIAAHSYPAVSVAELQQTLGVSLSTESVIAQTQAAIWSIASPDFEYLSLDGVSESEKATERVLFDYLTDPAINVGQAEAATEDPLAGALVITPQFAGYHGQTLLIAH